MYFFIFASCEPLKQLKSRSDGKATGTDEIPAKLLKTACHSIVVPFTHIINFIKFNKCISW